MWLQRMPHRDGGRDPAHDRNLTCTAKQMSTVIRGKLFSDQRILLAFSHFKICQDITTNYYLTLTFTWEAFLHKSLVGAFVRQRKGRDAMLKITILNLVEKCPYLNV